MAISCKHVSGNFPVDTQNGRPLEDLMIMPTDSISRQSNAITCQSDPLDEDAKKKVPIVASTAPSACFEPHNLHSLRITSLCQLLPYPTLTFAPQSSALLIRRNKCT